MIQFVLVYTFSSTHLQKKEAVEMRCMIMHLLDQYDHCQGRNQLLFSGSKMLINCCCIFFGRGRKMVVANVVVRNN